MTYEQIKPYVDNGLVNEQKHPECNALRIFNYTPECQFSKVWDDVTRQCRGLIMNVETGEIIARPFQKFFNYEEHVAAGDTLPDEVPVVYPKFDGSLGILYWLNNEPYVATRGSFSSDQAKWATAFIHRPDIRQWVEKLDRSFTYLFEIIYPENRIVVSYGDRAELVHLATIDTKTGRSVEVDSDFPMAAKRPFTSYQELKGINAPNEEGFVLHYPKADMRVKIKFEDYVRLHKIMTGLSTIGVWEMLRDGVDPLSQDIPDEMHPWLRSVMKSLNDNYSEIECAAKYAYEVVRDLPTRKEQAIKVQEIMPEHSSVVFMMLDEKDYRKTIWRKVRPYGSKTFTKDIDA